VPGQTPSQTAGPFFSIGLLDTEMAFLVPADTAGAVVLSGLVLDGAGDVVPDALVELWQADAAGVYPTGGEVGAFRGFGRVGTADGGRFRFVTIRPGPVPGPDGRQQAPHLNLTLFARGLLRHLFTRVYFADEQLNDADPLLSSIPAERRATLLAVPDGADSTYRFDIVLQGDGETVFLDL
jgi:protocatechuate 3,4-dioxygenase, alpha subunit